MSIESVKLSEEQVDLVAALMESQEVQNHVFFSRGVTKTRVLELALKEGLKVNV